MDGIDMWHDATIEKNFFFSLLDKQAQIKCLQEVVKLTIASNASKKVSQLASFPFQH